MQYKRIVAHTDFDGLISAFLLREIFGIENITFTEPWKIQRGDAYIKAGDIIVDLPYDERCALWIDHHKSNSARAEQIKKEDPEKVVFDATKKSCPALIYEHFHKEYPFLEEENIQTMVQAADKIDSASFSITDIEHPDAWGQMSMSLKSDNKRKDDEYRMLILNFLSFQAPEKILEQAVIKKRVEKKTEEHKKWSMHIRDYAHLIAESRMVLVDLTSAGEEMGDAPPFMIYTKYPEVLLSVTINTIKTDDATYKVSIGKNIFKRGPEATILDIGAVVKTRGGGGHADVGGCSFPKEEKEAFIADLLAELEKKL